jgi:hypothetical protein
VAPGSHPGTFWIFVHHEDAALAKQLNQRCVEGIGVASLEAEETLVLEVEVVEPFLTEGVSQLRQQGGFACPAQPGDDQRVGQRRGVLKIGQPCALDARVPTPEGLELLQQHGPDLILGPS